MAIDTKALREASENLHRLDGNAWIDATLAITHAVPALLDEVEALRAQVEAQRPLVEAARALKTAAAKASAVAGDLRLTCIGLEWEAAMNEHRRAIDTLLAAARRMP